MRLEESRILAKLPADDPTSVATPLPQFSFTKIKRRSAPATALFQAISETGRGHFAHWTEHAGP
jgi:hypothetical protein